MCRKPARLLVPLICLWLAACSAEPEVQRAEFLVFGTLVDITVLDTDPLKVNEAFAEIQASFQLMHRDWHAWEPGLLTGVNEAFAAGLPATADADIVMLVKRSQEIERLSEGCFNPAIGALIRLWGFHTSDYPVLGPPPSDEAIGSILLQKPSSLGIQIDGLTLTTDNRSVQLDFGGIAKGYAIDLAMEVLRSKGIHNAIVNAGGDLKAMGGREDRPWRIAIRSPSGGIIGTIETMGDEAIFSSGVYERFREDEHERYPHILDPRTGWPVSEMAAATVISREGLLADAAATALIVAGYQEGFRVARALGLDQVLLIDQSGSVFLTRDMEQRVKFVDGVERTIIPPPGD